MMSPQAVLADLSLTNSWVTIGSFDGVHLGHQNLLARLSAEAHQAGGSAIALTFYPHPAVVLRGRTDPFYLSGPQEREELILRQGIDRVFTLPFDADFASQTAEEFVRLLVERLGMRELWVGPDFALGRGRAGGHSVLSELGQRLGYRLRVIPPFEQDGQIISSSRIRALLREGRVDAAHDLLGRVYAVSGPVVHGDARGRKLGIPTANIDVQRERLVPASGVYAGWALLGGERVPAVTNVGTRPTFEPQPVQPRVEVLLLDTTRDLYGEELGFGFRARLRDERRFPDPATLVAQIQTDIQTAREILAHDA